MVAEAKHTVHAAYPITLASQRNGAILVSFPDVPEALTEGESELEALAEAQDCLIAALGGYIFRGWAIPDPSIAGSRRTVQLPQRVTGKLALYAAMRERKILPGTLAEKLGKPPSWVDRLLDLDERSHAAHLHDALTTVIASPLGATAESAAFLDRVGGKERLV